MVGPVEFDHANIHALANFVQMTSRSFLVKHYDKQHIFQAYDRSYILPLFTDDKDVRMPGKVPKKSAGKSTGKSISKSTDNAKAKATPTKPPESSRPIQNILCHIKNWDVRQLTAMNGPDTNVELNELVARLIDIRRRLRTSKKPKSCSTFAHAIYSCATKSGKDDTDEK